VLSNLLARPETPAGTVVEPVVIQESVTEVATTVAGGSISTIGVQHPSTSGSGSIGASLHELLRQGRSESEVRPVSLVNSRLQDVSPITTDYGTVATEEPDRKQSEARRSDLDETPPADATNVPLLEAIPEESKTGTSSTPLVVGIYAERAISPAKTIENKDGDKSEHHHDGIA
jgi:hypothetical protein